MENNLFTPKFIEKKLERILLRVQKPGRYVGGELNQVIKNWEDIKSHVALVFPDIYDVGLPNLGLAILYETLNNRSDVWAERAFSPWVDMQDQMKESEIPLYSLESKHPLFQFDIVGISIPYESLYTNVLNILKLSRIPLYSQERGDSLPLVLAGGHAMFNPEPMAPFLDAVLIGEADEAIHEIVDIHQEWKLQNSSRKHLLKALSNIDGIYIPSFYQPKYFSDGTIKKDINIIEPEASLPIKKRIVPKLPPPPTKLIVPSIDVVHNRIPIEIMRGCTRGCRFCHAGMINRPVRERSVEEIVEAIRSSLSNTGYEEVALLSLSSSDFSAIVDLIHEIKCSLPQDNLKVSLPSLRIESLSIDLLEEFKTQRKSSFTLAPEAASDHMRNIINKPISTEQVLDTVKTIYSRGWNTIKLYFMIGHPSENLEDIQAIIDLSKAVNELGKSIIGNRAKLNLGVSTFVPKPHTPFQWVACDSKEIIREKQELLRKGLKIKGVKYNWTDPENTIFESFLSRGDRRIAEVIRVAWEKGAQFDAWHEHFNFATWMEAFQECDLDPDFYTSRDRSVEEILPWDHISSLVKKSHLIEEYLLSQRGATRGDCREGCYACGILPELIDIRRDTPGDHWKCPDVTKEKYKTPTKLDIIADG